MSTNFLGNSDITRIATALVDHLNGTEDANTNSMFSQSLTTHGSGLDGSVISGNSMKSLAEAMRSLFPGISFSVNHLTDASDDMLLFRFPVKHPLDRLTADTNSIPCAFRFRKERGRVCEIWVNADKYSILQNQGRICADPGAFQSNSQAVNEIANESLRRAIVDSDATTIEGLDTKTLLHGRMELYRDISVNLDTELLETIGIGRTGEFIAKIKELFSKSPEVTFTKKISHGSTTSFKGTISARFNDTPLKYDFFTSFRSPANRIDECWIRIAPPLTLMECLT